MTEKPLETRGPALSLRALQGTHGRGLRSGGTRGRSAPLAPRPKLTPLRAHAQPADGDVPRTAAATAPGPTARSAPSRAARADGAPGRASRSAPAAETLRGAALGLALPSRARSALPSSSCSLPRLPEGCLPASPRWAACRCRAWRPRGPICAAPAPLGSPSWLGPPRRATRGPAPNRMSLPPAARCPLRLAPPPSRATRYWSAGPSVCSRSRSRLSGRLTRGVWRFELSSRAMCGGSGAWCLGAAVPVWGAQGDSRHRVPSGWRRPSRSWAGARWAAPGRCVLLHGGGRNCS